MSRDATERAASERVFPRAALRETCRVVAGRIPLWPYHRARLAAGGCGTLLVDEIEGKALQAASEWDGSPSSRVRLSLTISPRGEIGVGVATRLSSLDVPGGPVAVRVDSGEPPPLPQGAAKPADRGWWDEAQRLARYSKGHQAIIVAPGGQVVDGGSATVWIVEGTQITTPPAPPAVAGVARAFLLDAAKRERIRTFVEPINWHRYEAADEVFLTNAFGGMAPVRDRQGLVCRAVAELFEQIWRSA